MKTYTKTETVRRPMLEITHDSDAQSPREWDNLGYFITCESKYRSPDTDERLQNIVKNSGEVADNLADHIRLIKENYNNVDDKIIAIYPVYRYEHGNVSYKLGTAKGFDYANCGFYIITDKSVKDKGGFSLKGKSLKNYFETTAKRELATYTQWANGEVYRFVLHDKAGEVADSCGGFYDIEDIMEYLPKSWKGENLSAYFQN